MPTDLPADRIIIAPAVELILGPEQTARYRTEPQLRKGRCWECSDRVDAADEPVTVLIVEVDKDGPGELRVSRIAHARCCLSRVLTATREELNARAKTEPGYDPAEAGLNTVSASAMMWPPGAVTDGRPVVFVSAELEVMTRSATGDRVDLWTAAFLALGWEPAAGIGRAPRARPDGWDVAYQLYPGFSLETAPGHFQLIGPGTLSDEPEVYADINPLQTGAGWTTAAAAAGEVTVYSGPFGVDLWTEQPDYPGIQRAVKAGTVAAAILPAHILTT